MSETEQAAEVVAEETVEAEPVVEAPEEPAAGIEAEAEPEAEPEAVAVEEPEAEEAPEPAAEEPPAAPPASAAASPARQAKVFLCERGHRTVALWSAPASCHARPTRSGAECGRQLYPIGELPEQVQKALNPLKASKKASKG